MHAGYAQHLSVYAVSCTVGINFDTLFRLRKSSVVLDIETINKYVEIS